MKRNLFVFLMVSSMLVGFTSCKDDSGDGTVDNGTVTLDITSKDLVYGDVINIKPVFSATGLAKDKSYTWSSSADSIVGVKAVTGGYAEITAKRIGEATISFKSVDGVFTLTSKINVTPRSTLLNGIYYKSGASASDIRNNMTTGFTESLSESTTNYLVFSNTSNAVISKLIYELNNNALKATYVILNNTTDNRSSAEKYIEERYRNTGITNGGILFYQNTQFTNYAINTMIGVFIDTAINSETYPLGVKIIGRSYLN